MTEPESLEGIQERLFIRVIFPIRFQSQGLRSLRRGGFDILTALRSSQRDHGIEVNRSTLQLLPEGLCRLFPGVDRRSQG